MRNEVDNKCEKIMFKHLNDVQSDQVYQPIRELSMKFLLEKDRRFETKKDDVLYEKSLDAMIPSKVKGLATSTQPVNPLTKFRKIAERKRQYEPVPEGVVRNLLSKDSTKEEIVYKYRYDSETELTSSKRKFRCVSAQKKPQNQLKFGANLKPKVQKIKLIRDQKKQSYNPYSIFDEPMYHIRRQIMSTCVTCEDQVKDRASQKLYQLQG